MAAASPITLIVGDEPVIDERLVPLLRQARSDVRRAPRAAAAMREIYSSHFDLVVAVLPLVGGRELLASVRSEGSASLHAGLLVIDTDPSGRSIDSQLIPLANRMLPADASQEEMLRAITMLLGVAPRVPIRGSARVRLHAEDRERLLQVENVSTSGMLLRGGEALPVGSACGFELALSEQAGPIRGRARVVRHREQDLGLSFVSFGGEGAQLLSRLIAREMGGLDAPRPSRFHAGVTATRAAAPPLAVGAIAAEERAALAEAELAELGPFLDDRLRAGLLARLGATDWYTTGAELGLESLRAFSAVLEVVYHGQTDELEAQQLADLASVQEMLGEFARPQQGVQARMAILLQARPLLVRLLQQLADGDVARGGTPRERDAILQVCARVRRLLRARRNLDTLLAQLAELDRPRYLLGRRQLRARATSLWEQHRSSAAVRRLDRPELLTSRRRRRELALAIEAEIRQQEDWLAAVHAKVYRGKSALSAKIDADFTEERLRPALRDILMSGYEYLVRAYSAYRHALELAGADPALLDRVAGLTASLAAAQRQGARAASGDHPVIATLRPGAM